MRSNRSNSVKDLVDFRGGFFTDVPSPLLSAADLLTADDVHWRNGVTKRRGIRKYSTTAFASGTVLRGGIRTYQGSKFYDIIAVDNGATCSFYQGATASYSKISGLDFTTGYDVELAELNGNIVAVDGKDKPALITYSSGFAIKTVESNDVRTLGNADWWAGQYLPSATVTYSDDSTNAQSSATASFLVVPATDGRGVYVASDFTFNKIVFKNMEQAATCTAVYEYYDGSAWATVTMTTTPTWTAATGDKTIEFNIPLDFGVTPVSIAETGNTIIGRYAFRVRFTTAAAAAKYCDYLALYHTQKLTEVMAGEVPSLVLAHANRIWLVQGNNTFYSVANTVTGWKLEYSEYFLEGGPSIRGVAEYQNALIVAKDNALHAYEGNTFETFIKSVVSDKGTSSHRSMVMVGNILFRVWNNGVWAWNGTVDVDVSKHIRTVLEGYTCTDAAAVSYQGEYWVCFPTNAKLLTFDPDTIRQDDKGDYRVSFFRFTNHVVSKFLYHLAKGDNGYLLGLSNKATPYVVRIDNGLTDQTTTTTVITGKFQTKYDPFSGDGFKTGYRRTKVRVKQGTGSQTFKWLSDDGSVSSTASFAASSGTGTHEEDLSMPYTLDGRNLAFYWEHGASTSATLYGISVESFRRKF